jgi:Mn2+/Fe2+ NRAMP family transporter
MTESVFGAVSMPYPSTATPLKMVFVLVLTTLTVFAAVSGGVKRLQKVMTGLLMVILVCFIIVAVKGLTEWSTWIGLVKGLLPSVPNDIPIVGSSGTRSGFTQLMSIAGQALPAAVFLSFGYFTGDNDCTASDLKKNFRKTVFNLGVIFGLFSTAVVVCGATALHAVYTGGGLHYSQISSIADAGKVMAPALPSAVSFLATPVFSIGLLAAAFTTMISVALIMTYFTIDITGGNWKFRNDNKTFKIVFSLFIIVPALLSPFWKLDALLQAILGMVGNLVMAPVVIAVIMYFMNKKKYVGEYTAGRGRNIVLAITFLFALVVVVRGALNMYNQYF